MLGKVLVAQQATSDAQQQLAVVSAALDEYLLSQEASGSGATTGNTGAGLLRAQRRILVSVADRVSVDFHVSFQLSVQL